MLSKIIDFVQLLRLAGMKISPGDLLDLLKAVEILGIGAREFKWALEATLVKDGKDRDILDKFYFLFWFNSHPTKPHRLLPAPDSQNPPRLSPEEFSSRMSAIKDWLRRDLMEHKTLLPAGGISCGSGTGAHRPGGGNSAMGSGGIIDAVRSGEKFMMLTLIRKGIEELGEPGGSSFDCLEYIRRLKLQVGWAEGEDRLGGETDHVMAVRYQDNLNKLEQVMYDEVDRERWSTGNRRVKNEIAVRSNIELQLFDRLERRQSEEIKRKLVRLGRCLATRKGYRKSPATSGQVDLRRTVKMAGATGGITLKLYHQDRKPTRPELVLLCDLSGSVAPFSKFMLLLLGSMQSKFRLARSFAFVESVEEVTEIIRESDIDVSVKNIYRQTGIWQTGFSDYGEVWRRFREEHAGLIGSKTTLIVMGDARNNYKPDGRDYFEDIARRAGKVIWLNPAPREKWDREDSIMKIYAPYCDHVFECRNLSQLEKLAKKILYTN